MKTITLRNTFHNSEARVRGQEASDEEGKPAVRISHASYLRARRRLCGIKGCLCGRHGPYFAPQSGGLDTDYIVRGE